jgi:hypothetical protein
LWFAASLGSPSDPSFERRHVYRFTPAGGVAAAIGTDDFAIEQAVANPLKPGAPEYPAVGSWWESVYGAGSAKRQTTLTNLKSAASARDGAYQSYISVYNNPSVAYPTRDALYQSWAKANADWDNWYRAYRALPEEIDAFGVGDAAEFGYMPSTPIAPPMVPLPLP